MIIIRAGIQFVRLALAIKKKKDQDIQIIDLNGISEGDEAPQHTEKNLKFKKETAVNKITDKEKSYEISAVDESQ